MFQQWCAKMIRNRQKEDARSTVRSHLIRIQARNDGRDKGGDSEDRQKKSN